MPPSAMPRVTMCRAACLLLLVPSNGRAFRGHVTEVSMNPEDIRARVIEEVLSALGNSSRVTGVHLQALEDALRPMYLSMPKNEFGNLGHATARYVLHRLFVQRHAMYIKGLEPAGASWNATSSAASVLQDRVPSFVQSLFEERLMGKGLGIHELAVLAATLEHLIHDEAVKRLEAAYGWENLSTHERHTSQDLQRVLDMYMTLFIVGNAEASSTADALAEVANSYPGWPETQTFARQVQQSLTTSRAQEADFADGAISFVGMSAVVEEIGERYGRWQDAECRDLKASLTRLDTSGTGRVPLGDFYNAGLSGSWQFSESLEYLRELGAVDEASSKPNVLIPNYVNAHSNCLASSSIYSVCCINECEALMGHLETKVAAPEATPRQLLELVAALPSATVPAPRVLSSQLTDRLNEVAASNGGMVPLHGRLFAQWLHNAYPQECPYPHVAGKTNPMTADEWMQVKGLSVSATKEDMKRYLEAAPAVDPKAELPWSAEEELVAKQVRRTGSGSFFRKVLFIFFGLAAAFSFGKSAWQTARKTRAPLLPCVNKQHAC
mmetsp:Transcript_28943/g.67074  ORF Transcript_28943/g.67074 Transcript_28943/m.67074 type:complete len:553 (-) Transcript_28943:96-1754(-)